MLTKITKKSINKSNLRLIIIMVWIRLFNEKVICPPKVSFCIGIIL